MNIWVQLQRIIFLIALFHSFFTIPIFEDQRYTVDFNTSMQIKEKRKKGRKKRLSPVMLFCRKLYEQNNLDKREPLEDPLIPKKVHLIWIGPKEPPKVLKRCLKSIKKHLPDWECKLWTDEDVAQLHLINQEYFDDELNYGAKSDILRYELLYRFGGVYLDVDMVLLQPLDILNHTYEFYVGCQSKSVETVIGNALIASVPKHPIIKQCIETIKDHRNERSILRRTGPVHLEKGFYEAAKDQAYERVIALPRSFFYPYSYTQRKYKGKKRKQLLRPETFAVHTWAGTWIKQSDKRISDN